MENLQVESLPVGKIKTDPSQPRKTFSEDSLKELSESILELGLLQPITVTPSAKGYVIVLGERRYRATKLAKLETIDCIVRNFDKDIIEEVQIVENLQRKDVEPIEEAEAIEKLLKKYSAEEIAARIGRTVRFIYGRIKLAQLIDGFKPFVRDKQMTIALAINVAVLPIDEQQSILEGMGEKYQEWHVKNSCSNRVFNLAKAPFDLSDTGLVPKAGACSLCPFNSANQGSLFGDNKEICTKTTCYESKKSKSLHVLIEQVKKDGRLIVFESYRSQMNGDNNQLVISILEEQGMKAYMKDDVDIVTKPVKPTLKQIKEDNHWRNLDKAQLKEYLAEALTEYQDELKEFTDAPGNGYKTGLLFNTNSYVWKEELLKVKEKKADNAGALSVDQKKMDDCTPSEKILKINDRETRKKQLENNKQFEEVVNAVRETQYSNTRKTLNTDEMVAFCFNIYENHLGWHLTDKHFKDFLGNTSKKSRVQIVEVFKKNFTKDKFNKLIRVMMMSQVHFGEQNHTNNLVNISFYTAVKGYQKKEIEEIESKYEKGRGVRENRIKDRIAVLKTEIETLKST